MAMVVVRPPAKIVAVVTIATLHVSPAAPLGNNTAAVMTLDRDSAAAAQIVMGVHAALRVMHVADLAAGAGANRAAALGNMLSASLGRGATFDGRVAGRGSRVRTSGGSGASAGSAGGGRARATGGRGARGGGGRRMRAGSGRGLGAGCGSRLCTGGGSPGLWRRLCGRLGGRRLGSSLGRGLFSIGGCACQAGRTQQPGENQSN